MTSDILSLSFDVCKSNLLHWADTQNGFGSKKFLWPSPEALEVGQAENSGASKSGFFLLWAKIWALNSWATPKMVLPSHRHRS